MLWAETYAGENVELVMLRSLERKDELAPADYYVATTRNHLDRTFPDAPVVHSIGRAGAAFTVIKAGAGERP
jgi:hypothetical protein